MTNTDIEFESVLRLRPLFKKERDDCIVLEQCLTQQHEASAAAANKNNPEWSHPTTATMASTVVLHPAPKPILAPSSELVRQTLSPEAVVTARDVEFHLNRVVSPTESQEEVYFAIGLPMALRAMEPLKDTAHFSADATTITNNLLVVTGTSQSGKTYTSWGTPSSLSSRQKHDDDGILPRVIDSFFRQSKHNTVPNAGDKKKKLVFAVQMTFLQVQQNMNKPEDCRIHDLLQPPSSIKSKCLSQLSAMAPGSSKSPPVTNHNKSSFALKTPITSYSSLSDSTYLEQDSVTSEYRVVNAQIKTCFTPEDARETLQLALKHSNTLKHQYQKKRHPSHVHVTVQPVLLHKQHVAHRGGIVTVLDMAGYADSHAHHRARGKEDVSRSAHAAVVQCLATVHAKRTAVPFRQHALTMLLQSLLLNCCRAHVLVLVAAYAGHRDYAEKKTLLEQVSAFTRAGPTRPVSTGLAIVVTKKENRKHSTASSKKHRSSTSSTVNDAYSDLGRRGEDRRDSSMKVPIAVRRQEPHICVPGGMRNHHHQSSYMSSDSSSCSNSDGDLPPPVAPSYILPPSAPPEYESYAPMLDFPGVRPESMRSTKSFDVSLEPKQESACDEGRSPLQAMYNCENDSSSSSFYKFSPMKTFNDMVHVTKKKGKQVMDKTVVVNKEEEQSDVIHRLHALELENQRLVQENETLYERNEKLQQENDSLKEKQALVHERPESPRLSRERRNNSRVDAALFAHMAQVGRKYY
jgi:hypothetical protein